MRRARMLTIGVAAFAVCGPEAAFGDTVTVTGEAQKLGAGFAQVYAELGPEARPGCSG